MELGPQKHNRDGLSVPNSIIVVYMDPLGIDPSQVSILRLVFVQKSLCLDVAVAHAGRCCLQGAASHFCFSPCAQGWASDNASH